MQLNGRWTYQGRKQLKFIEHCRQRRTVIDVGGHVGLWSFNFAHAFRHVYAFEPVAAHRECFVANTQSLDNIQLMPYALGVEQKRVSIASEPGSSGNSTVCQGEDVEMRLLDEFSYNEVDGIKLDCEGYEENVLRGAVDTIRRNKPTIIVEQKRDMASRFDLTPGGAVEYLVKVFGYRVVEVISGDYILVP
jgi:FkbM family methyltransferase